MATIQSLRTGRKKRNWPAIYPNKNAAGRVNSYVVDLGLQKFPGNDNPKRVRFFYKTLREAETKAEQMRIARRNEGLAAITLPTVERVDYEGARQILSPLGVSLTQAAEFYRKHFEMIKQRVSVADVVAELLAIKEQDGRAERYLRDLRVRLNRFAESKPFKNRSIHEIDATEIDDWLRALSGGSVNRKNYRRLVSVLFSFALKRKYVLKNPVKEVEIPTVKPTKPGILTVPEVRALLEAATPEFLPAIALGVFAGLRPESEVWRLKWEDINLDERLIDVAHSKNTAGHRYVRIEDNLALWLARYSENRGPICLQDEPYFRRLRGTRERAILKLENQGLLADNLRSWPNDCLRHCFASYHCTQFGDSRRTSQEMGHSGDLTVFNYHYRNRVKPVDAQAFWLLAPSAELAS
jgi:integrase